MLIDLRRPRGSKDAYERAMINDSLSLNHRRRRESKDVSRGPRGAGDASLASDDHHTAKVDGRARLGDRAGGGPSDSLLVKNDSIIKGELGSEIAQADLVGTVTGCDCIIVDDMIDTASN